MTKNKKIMLAKKYISILELHGNKIYVFAATCSSVIVILNYFREKSAAVKAAVIAGTDSDLENSDVMVMRHDCSISD